MKRDLEEVMKMVRENKTKTLIIIFIGLIFLLCYSTPVLAQPIQLPNVNLSIGGEGEGDLSSVIQLVILLTVLTLAPAIVILLTSFTRIVVVLAFVRTSLATQQMPPNQVLIGLALFLTFFIMAPTLQQVNANALQPYMQVKWDKQKPLRREWSLCTLCLNKLEKDLALFVKMSNIERPRNFDDIPNYVYLHL